MQQLFFFNITKHIEHILTYLRTQNCKHNTDLFFTLPAVEMLTWKSSTAIENREKHHFHNHQRSNKKEQYPDHKKHSFSQSSILFTKKNYKNRKWASPGFKMPHRNSKNNGVKSKTYKIEANKKQRRRKERVLRQQWKKEKVEDSVLLSLLCVLTRRG